MNVRLVGSHEVAPDIRQFTFEVPDEEQFFFIPGQFVSFQHQFEGKNITRAYSIASAPGGNQFEVCLNRVEGGLFSPYLFGLSPGEILTVSAPLGYFVLRDPAHDSVFVATGTGITPFRSMLHTCLRDGHPHQITLVFGVRHERNLLYRAEFEQMERDHPNFRFWPTLSRPELGWTGRTGHVQSHVLEAVGDRRDLDVYICGLKLMVDDIRAKLKALGLDRKQIVYEKYD